MKRLQNLAVINRVYIDETSLRGLICQAIKFRRMRSHSIFVGAKHSGEKIGY
ncbi:hypothetical protein NDI44_09995 [Trichocoleus sp. DQ-A3]|uniref:hypothetical protein n=1 Tax=Cyanophyceae TaxID=3028117 RepID=UPI001682EFFF|nr:hypothetical protein [Coleofasciculus sp. FACHB-125]MBD1903088.1 hypothetical protein [Coleofasciculus sp. FACHB-125]